MYDPYGKRYSSFEKVIIILVIFLFPLIILMFGNFKSDVEKAVISGEKTLTCQFKDGWRDIPKEMVINYNEETGYWRFKNGYAKNCEVQ